ncbi:hypothetical protein PoB_000047800 [Plakobranchus ocellatus]|uniref:GP-PDE domain-containing protein n=1 Tax=Plakobranchus ocellatus TaxID=259542 RepID=A0AAV3XVG5_9GAST|nr:hypothetical protein PoB_000047800 [Plakobranchus ocellatus]
MTKTAKAIWVSVFLCGMLMLYLSPLTIDTPVFRSDTPPKPEIVAMGGASDISPENTMFAFQEAVDLGAKRLYSTVQISYDGVPFLMSDHSLLRTTNVNSVFPNRTSDDPTHFTMDKLLSLSAGTWFLDEDPWDTKGGLSNSERLNVEKETVPTLSSLIRLVETEDLQLYLSIRNLPSWHPYKNEQFQKILQVLQNETQLKHSNVFLPPEAFKLDQSFGLFADPASPVWDEKDIAESKETDRFTVYTHVKTDMASIIEQFRARNISTLVMEVNSGWFLSFVWCADADLVATHYVEDIDAVGSPIIHLNKHGYLALWVTTDVLSIAAILIMFIVQRVRLYGTNFSPEAISLSTGRVRTSHRSRTMKEKLLREGATMDSLDDVDALGSGGAGGPGAVDPGEAEGGGAPGPAYSTTSSQQTYSTTSLPAPTSTVVVGFKTGNGHHQHHMTGSLSDGEVRLSPPATSVDRYSV